ncbi:MAG: polysaccharide pyruvyl transferase [Planctomycetes bacterium]|nr:polysaccharide pyruvyl transferase [Planctomycetota bacterium]
MRLYYYKDPHGNLGDDLNPWLWPRLLPGLFDDDPRQLFVGIGTLLTSEVPREGLKVVFGSGAWCGRPLPQIDSRWRIYCVRGPLTADLLGLDRALVATDAAALVRAVELPRPTKRHDVAYMPHHFSAQLGGWKELCGELGIHYIDPAAGVDATLDEVLATETLVTEAMHGAIVADALRVPWIAVKAYPHILDFKWVDWCRSLRIEHGPHRLPGLWSPPARPGLVARLRSGAKRKLVASALRRAARAKPQLSDERVLGEATDRLLGRLEALREDWKAGRQA